MNDTPSDVATIARRALAVLDLTSLGEDDTPVQIAVLCAHAAGPGGPPASLCVYPEHIGTARRALADAGLSQVPVGTVVNFPDGGADPARVRRETRRAVAAGAGEIDMVLPWSALLDGDAEVAREAVVVCRRACQALPLKVILETSALPDAATIRAAAELALEAGADFIKTSTGKIGTGATPEAAKTMLEVIRDRRGHAGCKISGGVRTLADAATYLDLADSILGAGWADHPSHFRIGASGLLAEIRHVLSDPAAGPET